MLTTVLAAAALKQGLAGSGGDEGVDADEDGNEVPVPSTNVKGKRGGRGSMGRGGDKDQPTKDSARNEPAEQAGQDGGDAGGGGEEY